MGIESKVHEAVYINMTATEYMNFFRFEYDVDWMVSDMYWSGVRSYAFVHNENNHLAGAGSHHGFPKRFKNYCHYHRYEPFYNYFQTQKANLWNMIYYGPFIGPLVQGIVGWLVSVLGSGIVNWLVDYLLGQVMGLISKMMASFCTVYCEGEGCELQDYGRDYLANVISFKALVDISHLSGVASQEVLAVTKQGERHDNYAEQQYQLMKRGESSSNKRQINLPPYSYTGRTAVADNGSTVLLPHYPVFISHGKARDMLGTGAKSYDVKEASSTDETIIEVTRRGGVFGFRTGNDFYHPHKNCQTDYCNTRISSCGGTMWELANLYGHLMDLVETPGAIVFGTDFGSPISQTGPRFGPNACKTAKFGWEFRLRDKQAFYGDYCDQYLAGQCVCEPQNTFAGFHSGVINEPTEDYYRRSDHLHHGVDYDQALFARQFAAYDFPKDPFFGTSAPVSPTPSPSPPPGSSTSNNCQFEQKIRQSNPTGTHYDFRGTLYPEDLMGLTIDMEQYNTPGTGMLRQGAYNFVRMWARVDDSDTPIPTTAYP